MHRFRFFGREAISFLLVLPIALPGIITGMALNSYFTFWKFNFGLWTIVIGHATFCVVVVYNNVIARLRRVPGSLTEASMDLGADGFQTFRYVTFPTISTALISGGLLAFALSFDEVIVTTFTAGAKNTLPIWIFGQIRLGQQLPQVNVVVFLVLAVTDHPRRARAATHPRERDPAHRIGERLTWQPLDVLNPATGESIANVPNMSADEVDEVVERAKQALPEWLDATPGERAELLLKLADVILADNAEELAQIESRNVGKPLMVSRDEMPFSADNLRFFAGAARNLEGKSRRRVHQGLHVDDPARADRDRRRHLPVELPADDGGLEARARRSPPATCRS